MPRTKISKNSKRNREAANREEKIRTFEIKMDSVLTNIDDVESRYKAMVEIQLQALTTRMPTELREMKMALFLELLPNLEHFADFKPSDQTQYLGSQSLCANTTTGNGGSNSNCNIKNSSALTASSNSRNDEEDSCLSGGAISAYGGSMRSVKAMRTPGPLHSARARRERRSRSACGAAKVLPNTSSAATGAAGGVVRSSSNASRISRSKMRTPMTARPKAFSADRTPRNLPKQRSTSPSTPPMAFLRWPKPGEVALSKYGSPIVAQVMPDKFANCNIPIRNGVLSLRPKKLDEVKSDLVEHLDSDTLSQIKTLHENLQMIMNSAKMAGLK
ncbi:borealin isoform X2 [Drosophila grimshawi]|uniref:borealin isoform X2 n=1 Tax=Drosophila grimshawi TaxID=7222 RepID=UPI000C870BCB|nr:borealin isoform X2 [Drosophila grimshawi]XP_043070432.1 borealin isoform X2 [Drosophila grimshawi]